MLLLYMTQRQLQIARRHCILYPQAITETYTFQTVYKVWSEQKHFTRSIDFQCTNNNDSYIGMFYIRLFVYGYEDLFLCTCPCILLMLLPLHCESWFFRRVDSSGIGRPKCSSGKLFNLALFSAENGMFAETRVSQKFS
jgi:hypothetical protein